MKLILNLGGLLFCLSGCVSAPPAPTPKLDLNLYVGDPESKGITRKQKNETIGCEKPEISKYMCMSSEDWQKMLDYYFGGCDDWYVNTE